MSVPGQAVERPEATLFLFVGVPLLVALVLRGRKRGPAPAVPLPTCGVVPRLMSASLLLLPAMAAAWIPVLNRDLPSPGSDAFLVADLVLTAGFAFLTARLFCGPEAVVRAWERSARRHFGEAERGEVKQALARANRNSLLVVLALAVLPKLVSAMELSVSASGVGLAMLGAILLDFVAELRARARLPALALARPLHRVYAVEPVLAALERTGIAAVARARYFRALFHFFAPYAPIEILVPVERVREADAICASIASDAELELPAVLEALG